MIVLQVLSIAVGILSGLFGFSPHFYMNFRSAVDPTFKRANNAYFALLGEGAVDDSKEVKDLLKLVRSSLAKYDTPDVARYGMLRRWEETTRIIFRPGEVEKRENFIGINPIYGYNLSGEETFVADKNTFHHQFVDVVTSGQQRTAFLVLITAFLLQLVALVSP